jgi:CRISPR-associated protein Cas1
VSIHPVALSDRIGFVYVDHATIERDQHGLVAHSQEGELDVPVERLGVLLLGPGAAVSHAAIDLCARSGCLVLWTGESGVRLYAAGNPRANAQSLLRQAAVHLDHHRRLLAARQVWRQMFDCDPAPNRSIEQLRGDEGARVRAWLPQIAQECSLQWPGRDGGAKDPLNQAINAATSTLYGVCEAAILILGYSPAIGMIHDGDARSFVFDVADTIKFRTVVPLAMRMVAQSTHDVTGRVRRGCRDLFYRDATLADLVRRIQGIFDAADRA